ncbi:radical SAM protein [Helicobacter sp. WB40]|uniref:radical SAM protein n=1 Tax=Helicobacter sp. WB40 TaxID=3004130 RepID=UPI0022EBC595|nr:radical SAM protein [Helicobacter sp. WB40]MDA3967440.1 radical SAM protein [Helicobacter sp. WB40]
MKLETSSNCTARCLMCGIDEWKRGGAIMKDELFFKIANEIILHKNDVTKVALFVGNEPLLDKSLAFKIKKFKDSNIAVNFSTNASLLDFKKAKEILDSGLDAINFSIDSLDKKEYEKIRKNLIFERVMANVICFLKMRNEKNYKTKNKGKHYKKQCKQRVF